MTNLANPSTNTTSGSPPKKVATRQAQLHRMLCRQSGATIVQIQKAFGWQPHTARAAISAQRKAGSVVVRRDGEKGPVYRIISEGEGA